MAIKLSQLQVGNVFCFDKEHIKKWKHVGQERWILTAVKKAAGKTFISYNTIIGNTDEDGQETIVNNWIKTRWELVKTSLNQRLKQWRKK